MGGRSALRRAKIRCLCVGSFADDRIEDLVSNILMANQNQLFNEEWKERIGSCITDTGNALELDEAISFAKGIHATGVVNI